METLGKQIMMLGQPVVGQLASETASIAYTGELLPTGTASYGGISIDATKRYLKNSGKDKTPALVESGQGKFFNGTNQYLNTGIIPNQAEGTLVTRATLGDTSANRYIVGAGGANANCSLAFDGGYLKFIFGNSTLVSTGVLGVVGRSYHIALKHTGLNVRIYVDGVFVFSKDVTAFTPVNALGVGARWTGSAALYFNSVINETYYYDVALTDAQIETLYKYPEKVKAYNGAIVPDIGSEANCKLFLPMCENAGSNVVNVAVAKQDENYYNGTVTLASSDAGAGGEVSVATSIGGGAWNLKVTTVGTNIISPYLTLNGTRPIETVSKTIDIEFDAVVTSGTCYITKYYNGKIQITLNSPYLIKNGHNILTVQTRASNSAIAYLYLDGTKLFDVAISNITSKASVSYPLASYSTTMHTSAAKLPYGAQCIAWKRDSLGVLLGMSNGLSFDGGVSVNPISSGYIPLPSEDWAIETIVYLDESNQRSKGNGTNTTGRMHINSDTVGWIEVLCGRSVRKQPTTGYHHIAIQFNTTTKTFNAWYDGVLFGTNVDASAYGIPTLPYSIGGIIRTTTTWDNKTALVQGTTKIHKGTQYAKFNIDKAWAKAQKTIAKLGA